MDEYISREELRKHLKDCYDDELFDADMKKAVIGIDIYVENMPSIETELVKHGRWINLTPMGQRAKQRMTWHGCVTWMCSECHGAARFFSEDLPYELCPHCGAIMTFGGGEEEQCAHAEYMERVEKVRIGGDSDE